MRIIKWLILSLWIGSSAFAIILRDDKTDADYQNLADDDRFNCVGIVKIVTDHPGVEYGTGFVINPRTVITAGHVVDEAGTIIPGDSSIAFGADPLNSPTDGSVLSATYLHAGFVDGSPPINDIAFLMTSRRLTSITPATISTGTGLGKTAYTAGYGGTGNGITGYTTTDYLKRAMGNAIDLYSDILAPGHYALLQDFDDPDGTTNTITDFFGAPSSAIPVTLEGATYSGDSGGPLMVSEDDEWKVVGLTSFGYVQDGYVQGEYGSILGYLPIKDFAVWIAANNPVKAPYWTGASGAWNTAGSWSSGVVPQNTADTFYEAALSQAATVTVDVNFTVDEVNVTHEGAALVVPVGFTPLAYETNISAGFVQVDGQLSSAVTLTGGYLYGTGTIVQINPQVTPVDEVPALFNTGGTIMPGSSSMIGTLTLTGAFSQGSAGTLAIKFASTVSHDLFSVSGAAVIAGVVHLDLQNLPALGDSFTVLSSALLTGTVTNVTGYDELLDEGLFPEIHFSATDVYFNIVRSYGSRADTFNQLVLADELDYLRNRLFGDFATVRDALNTLSDIDMRKAFDQMSPQMLTPMLRADIFVSQEQLRKIKNHLEMARMYQESKSTSALSAVSLLRGDLNPDQDAESRHAARFTQFSNLAQSGFMFSGKKDKSKSAKEKKKSLSSLYAPQNRGAYLFCEGFFGDRSSTKDDAGYSFKGSGVQGGYDFCMAKDMVAGFSAAYADSNSSLSDRQGSVHAKGFSGILYSSIFKGSCFVDAMVKLDKTWHDVVRKTDFATIERDVKSQPKTRAFEASLGFGMCRNDKLIFEPKCYVDAYFAHMFRFTERDGDSLNLKIYQKSITSVQTILGFTAGKEFDIGRSVFLPYFSGLWAHEYSKNTHMMDFQFNDPVANIVGQRRGIMDRDSGIFNAGVIFNYDNLGFYASYEMQFSKADNRAHFFDAGMRCNF